MTWTDGIDRATGYIVPASVWNEQLGATGSLMELKLHTHDGTNGDGSTSLGPLVLMDFSDAAAPAAPGAGKTRISTNSGRPIFRAGAAGASLEILTEDMFDAKGDLMVASAADQWARLAVGADDTILMADSGQATGLKWSGPATTSEIADVASAEGAGTSDLWARGDHVHAHEAAHINHDTTWAAKGDLIAATGNDAAAVVTVGANGTVLTADSSQASGVKWQSPTAITIAAEQATTSGTSIDFTGIPAGVKRITVLLEGVSTNGTSNPMIQIGDSGGIETSGYAGSFGSSGATHSAGFQLQGGGLANLMHGVVVLHLKDSANNTWTEHSSVAREEAAVASIGAGSKSLSGVLDRVRLTTVNGTDTFDAGSMSIMYE